MELADRLAGAVWGHLVGDAVGVPYEFKPAAAIKDVHFGVAGTHSQPPGTWSDDGALMLALLDSLVRDRAPGEQVFDTADQATRFLAWADDRAYTPDDDGKFDIGGATSSALRRLRRSVPAEMAGGTGERDNGNGSLMRILPLALIDPEHEPFDLVDAAHRASAVTHGHLVSQVTCALYVLIAHDLLMGESLDSAFREAEARLRDRYRESDPQRLTVLQETLGWSGRSGSGYVVDAFWSAWEALIGSSTYREAIERAIRYGNDTDTTAAIAGGLAGIRFGLSGIPSHWLAKMRGQDIVDPLVARLTGRRSAALASTASASNAAPVPPGARTSTSHPLYVNWVEPSAIPADAGWTGRLGMTILPGKHDRGIAGLHWRDLEADVARLASELGVGTFVLLVEDDELVATGTSAIADEMAANGIELVRYPIIDGAVPVDRAGYAMFLAQIDERLRAGVTVVIACKGGLGRTGTTAACLLEGAGLDADSAIALTRTSRPMTIENATQEAFVRSWTPSRER